jgi:hypothetical protein
MISTIGDTDLQNYFAVSPTITVFNPSFGTFTTTPANVGSLISNALNLSSTTPGLYLTYTYNVPVSSVPGPLPIAGVGIAFRLSRKFRRRIKTAVV